MTVVESGKGVIIKKGNNLKYVYVSNSAKVEKMENFFFSCKDLIGHPFGSAFKVLDKERLLKIDPVLVETHNQEYENAGSNLEDTSGDNREIQDDSNSQRLGKNEIEAMRDEGKSGEEIVKEIVENSSTFQGRNIFSKSKYLKKKNKKYIAHFVVLKPTTRLLAEMYFQKNPTKILELRPDTLAQILTYSNVQFGSKVLVLETCQGLVAGSILERLGSKGSILQIYQGSFPVRIVMEQFNYSEVDTDNVLCSYPLEKLGILPDLLKSGKSDEDLIEFILGKHKDEQEHIKKIEISKNLVDCNLDTEEIPLTKIGEKRKFKKNESEERKTNFTNIGGVRFLSREKRMQETLTALKLLRNNDFESLILVSKYHPKLPLLTLLDYLPPSCPFVVYFTHQEPLMECFVNLKDKQCATNLELTESWFRNIQVLPKRTHPEIVMSGTGGYLLRGIKVDPS
uniref:tRNA (adenine(58)-N(1))-methyltransferase non-catalytic subunit TRM6 n=1 Tax=Hydra vulgaris TaxID=6087 RepID=T2M3Q6_HYDVU